NGEVSHIISIYLDECKHIKKGEAIEVTKEIMLECANNPYILQCKYCEWTSASSNLLKQSFISMCIIPDLFCFSRELPSDFNFNDLIKILLNLAIALKLMHDKNIAHLDIKPENVLIEMSEGKPGKIYLIDFDSSLKLVLNLEITPRGTAEFIAPELDP